MSLSNEEFTAFINAFNHTKDLEADLKQEKSRLKDLEKNIASRLATEDIAMVDLKESNIRIYRYDTRLMIYRKRTWIYFLALR